MENNILDNFQEKTQSPYATRALSLLLMAMGAYGLIFLFTGYLSVHIEEEFFISLIIIILGLIAFIFTLFGFINGIISFVKKEQAHLKKYSATVGNFLLLLIMGLIIFANILDFISFTS